MAGITSAAGCNRILDKIEQSFDTAFKLKEVKELEEEGEITPEEAQKRREKIEKDGGRQ